MSLVMGLRGRHGDELRGTGYRRQPLHSIPLLARDMTVEATFSTGLRAWPELHGAFLADSLGVLLEIELEDSAKGRKVPRCTDLVVKARVRFAEEE